MRTFFSIVLCLAATGAARAQDGSQTPPDNTEHLKQLEWLAGTWDGKGTFDGKPYTSETTYEWTMNRNFLRVHYAAKMGEQVVWQDTTMIGWDRQKKKLVWFTFGLDGSIGGGEQQESKEKDVWVIEGGIPGDTAFAKTRTYLRRTGTDSLKSTIQTWKDGAWVTFMECDETRRKPEKAEPGK